MHQLCDKVYKKTVEWENEQKAYERGAEREMEREMNRQKKRVKGK
jgi:hypothetical protein